MSQDSRLQQAVRQLDRKPDVTAARVGIKSDADPVRKTAGGPVAGTAVIRIQGITAVADAAEVQMPSRTGHGDDDMAATAAECLAWPG